MCESFFFLTRQMLHLVLRYLIIEMGLNLVDVLECANVVTSRAAYVGHSTFKI